jgi:hypothetical protein
MELDFLDDEETIPRALEQRYPILFTVVARDTSCRRFRAFD